MNNYAEHVFLLVLGVGGDGGIGFKWLFDVTKMGLKHGNTWALSR